ncbi:hypothetical protein Emed_004403 [Eimeria media]
MTPDSSSTPPDAELEFEESHELLSSQNSDESSGSRWAPLWRRPAALTQNQIAGLVLGLAFIFVVSACFHAMRASGGLTTSHSSWLKICQPRRTQEKLPDASHLPLMTYPGASEVLEVSKEEKADEAFTGIDENARQALRQSLRVHRILSGLIRQGMEELEAMPSSSTDELRGSPEGRYVMSLTKALEFQLSTGTQEFERWSRYLTKEDMAWWAEELLISSKEVKKARKKLDLDAWEKDRDTPMREGMSPRVSLLVRLEAATKGLLVAVRKFVDLHADKGAGEVSLLSSAYHAANETVRFFELEEAKGGFIGSLYINGMLRVRYNELKELSKRIPPLLRCHEYRKKMPTPTSSDEVFEALTMQAEALGSLAEIRHVYPKTIKEESARKCLADVKRLLAKAENRLNKLGPQKLGTERFERGTKAQTLGRQAMFAYLWLGEKDNKTL